MLLINGMPVIHIELKKSGVPVSQACNQIEKYANEGIFTGLFSLIQIFVAMNPEDTVYFANPGPEGRFNLDFYFHWADFNNEPIHGFKNDNDFYLDKGKMKFAPFRSVLGGSYIPSVINPMFGSIIETLKTYYGKQIDFDKLLNNTTLRKQSTLLAHIENLDGLILQEKINEAYKGNII